MNSLKHVVVEYRKFICCANFFVELLAPFEGTITLDVNSVTLNNAQSVICKINVVGLFEIRKDSLSVYKASGNFVSFRVSTGKPFDFAQKKCIDPNKYLMQVNVSPEDNIHFICCNCQHILTLQKQFAKIRELPSENLSMDEWVCGCSHSNHTTTDHQEVPVTESGEVGLAAQTNSSKITPKKDMLLYGCLFVVVNSELLHPDSADCEKETLRCRNCRAFLGESIPSGTMKLWNDTVNVVKEASGDTTPQSLFILSVEPIAFILQKALRTSQIVAAHIFLFTRTVSGEMQFLSMKVCGKSLELEVSDPQAPCNLVKHNAIKLEYRCNSSLDEMYLREADDPVVCRVEVSEKLFGEATAILGQNSNFIPQDYRSNDEYLYSYILMD